MNNTICHYIFLDCLQYTDGRYVLKILEDLAFGIAPSSSYIHKNVLYCVNPAIYHLQETDPRKLYLGVMEHLLTTQKERSRNEDWKKIRGKKVKELLLMIFVSKKND